MFNKWTHGPISSLVLGIPLKCASIIPAGETVGYFSTKQENILKLNVEGWPKTGQVLVDIIGPVQDWHSMVYI